jgi:hypothetical protein
MTYERTIISHRISIHCTTFQILLYVTCTQALAFLVYDRVGAIIEQALRTKYNDKIQELPQGHRLYVSELRAAQKLLPSSKHIGKRFSDRGSVGTVITSLPIGIRYIGNPAVWPCQVIHKDSIVIGVAPITSDSGSSSSARLAVADDNSSSANAKAASTSLTTLAQQADMMYKNIYTDV